MGKRLAFVILALLIATPLLFASGLGSSGLGTPSPFALEEDGSPSGIFTKIIFADGSLAFDGTHVHVTTQPSDALDLVYLRLDTTNDPITGALTTSNGSILANAAASSTLTLGGVGGTHNENILLDFDFDTNITRMTSGTGSQLLFNLTTQFGQRAFVKDNVNFQIGSEVNNDSYFRWDTTGNDCLQLHLGRNAADSSGYFMIVGLGQDRHPAATSPDPVLRVWSFDNTNPTDYIEFYHDQAKAVIDSGDTLTIVPNTTISGTLGAGDFTGTNIELSGASILANATASGILTLGGTGGTYDENITLNFDYLLMRFF